MQSLAGAVALHAHPQPGPLAADAWSLEDGWIFLIAAGTGAYLAATAAADVDMEAMSFRMQQQVTALGKAMTTPPRENAGSEI
ncbi:Roadblock/LC7 domain-containing protein OS=Streptomyces microflavus OX=1919 GN=G3I39_30800 PE=4 SV=1 [Streptomyces microflavus]